MNNTNTPRRLALVSGSARSYVEVTVEKSNTPGRGVKGSRLWCQIKLVHDVTCGGYVLGSTDQGWGVFPMAHEFHTFGEDRDAAVAAFKRAIDGYERNGYAQTEIVTSKATA